ncbi:hypothetical protein ACKKBG_A04590 [Auxenochlorella protothecoides x Auxenochlorella symbiontica]
MFGTRPFALLWTLLVVVHAGSISEVTPAITMNFMECATSSHDASPTRTMTCTASVTVSELPAGGYYIEYTNGDDETSTSFQPTQLTTFTTWQAPGIFTKGSAYAWYKASDGRIVRSSLIPISAFSSPPPPRPSPPPPPPIPSPPPPEPIVFDSVLCQKNRPSCPSPPPPPPPPPVDVTLSNAWCMQQESDLYKCQVEVATSSLLALITVTYDVGGCAATNSYPLSTGLSPTQSCSFSTRHFPTLSRAGALARSSSLPCSSLPISTVPATTISITPHSIGSATSSTHQALSPSTHQALSPSTHQALSPPSIKVPSSPSIKVPSSPSIEVPSSPSIEVPSSSPKEVPSSSPQEGVPASSQENLSASSQEGLPASSQEGVPASSQEGVPASSQEGLPASSQEGVAVPTPKKADPTTEAHSLKQTSLPPIDPRPPCQIMIDQVMIIIGVQSR